MRQAIALLLVWLLLFPATAVATASSVREQVLLLARDTAVEVRFLDKTKRVGRLGAVGDTGFELQTATGDKIETIPIPFDKVKSVRRADREPAGRSVGRVVLITGIVVGTVIGILALIGLAVSAAD